MSFHSFFGAVGLLFLHVVVSCANDLWKLECLTTCCDVCSRCNWRVRTTRLEQHVLCNFCWNIWVLGFSCLGLVQTSFGRQAAWRLGKQYLWGQSWLHYVRGPCLVVGAQCDTLKAWVVKLLGGLSASARAQRT